MPRSALACAFSLTVLLVTCGMANAQSRDAAAAAVPHAAQYDLKSSQNGQTYRLSIAAPFTIDPKVAYPVLYVLDGNFFFGSAAYIEAKLTAESDSHSRSSRVRQTGWPQSSNLYPAHRRWRSPELHFGLDVRLEWNLSAFRSRQVG